MIRKLKDILVISNIDGTLTTNDGSIPSSTLAAIRLFETMGGRFTLATGRTLQSISGFMPNLELNAPVIACGGAVIYNFEDRNFKKNSILPRPTAERLLRDIIQNFKGVGAEVMGADGNVYLIAPNETTRRQFAKEHLPYYLRGIDDLPSKWNKLLFAGPADMMKNINAFVSQQSYYGVYFASSDPNYLEIMPQGATKGAALQRLCTILRIPIENVIVLGSYFDDMDIMKVAGYSVAMGDAPDEVKNMANGVIGISEDSAVGHYLYHLVRQYGR